MNESRRMKKNTKIRYPRTSTVENWDGNSFKWLVDPEDLQSRQLNEVDRNVSLWLHYIVTAVSAEPIVNMTDYTDPPKKYEGEKLTPYPHVEKGVEVSEQKRYCCFHPVRRVSLCQLSTVLILSSVVYKF
jgi:hypothetical protein